MTVSSSSAERSISSRHMHVRIAGCGRGEGDETGFVYCAGCGFGVERVEGIEPSTKAWEAFVLPLNYTRLERLTLYQMFAEI